MKPHSFGRFVHAVFDGYLLVPAGVLIALIWANTAAESYFAFSIRMTFYVNEIGMALFLGLVTQEVMDATLPGGALYTWRRWSLPLIAAAGGVLGSAGWYLLYVHLAYQTVLAFGWPIATAVDLAAAYFILKLIFPRSSAAYPFVLLSALAADAFALMFIALRHFTDGTVPGAGALLLGAIGLAALLRNRRVRAFWPYLVFCAPLSWLAFYWDGLHPALSLLPIVPFLPHRPRGIDLLEIVPPKDYTRRIEREWAYVVQPVVFLFGLVNGGVRLEAYDTGSWALFTSAMVGRPLGMIAAVAIAVGAGLHLPARFGWRDIVVVSLATTTGFMLALFAATAVFPIGPLLSEAKFGALLTSAGALVTLVVARVVHVGRFAMPPGSLAEAPRARVRHAIGMLLPFVIGSRLL